MRHPRLRATLVAACLTGAVAAGPLLFVTAAHAHPSGSGNNSKSPFHRNAAWRHRQEVRDRAEAPVDLQRLQAFLRQGTLTRWGLEHYRARTGVDQVRSEGRLRALVNNNPRFDLEFAVRRSGSGGLVFRLEVVHGATVRNQGYDYTLTPAGDALSYAGTGTPWQGVRRMPVSRLNSLHFRPATQQQ
jgi:hypothetical protein